MARLQKFTGRERGNALVLAVLMVLALTSVGVVSIQRTNTDLLVAGNVVRAMQAQIAGDAVTTRSVALFGQIPQQAGGMVEKQIMMGRGGIVPDAAAGLEASDRKGSGFFKSKSNSANTEECLAMVDSGNPLARIRQNIAQDMDVAFVGEEKGWPGYDVNADICHLVFDFTGRGGIPTGDDPNQEALCPLYRDPTDPPCASKSVVVQVRARAVAGPVKCTGTKGGS
jgi:hypothetical protein